MLNNLAGRMFVSGLPLSLLLALAGNVAVPAQSVPLPALNGETLITNLLQLSASAGLTNAHAYGDVRLEAVVCAASRPQIGVLAVQDPTSAELLELGALAEKFRPGDIVQVEGRHCLLRRRDLGVEISAAPAVDNEGLHERRAAGIVSLKAGLTPLRLDWFNNFHDALLEVSCRKANGETQDISGLLFCRPPHGSNLVRGLYTECYDGYWESVPDFQLLRPAKTGVTTNFDLRFRTRDGMVAMRFAGYLKAPADGEYIFELHSHDGSLLFLGDPAVSVKTLGSTNAPAATTSFSGQTLDGLTRQWTTVEGRVNFIARRGRGLDLELCSGRNSIWVKVADAGSLDSSELLSSFVRVTGVGCGVLATDGRPVLGRLLVAGPDELSILESRPGLRALPPLLDSARQVQNLRLEDARHGLPVRIRGVVTSVSPPLNNWLSLQDNDRGIFVGDAAVSNAAPAVGELWEVSGHTDTGDFTPIVVADQMRFLGAGRMPEPARPTWNELNNGIMDVQWVEFQGLVTEIQSNTMTLLLPEGLLAAQMDRYDESDLKPFLNAVVRIRGTLFAVWDSATREVRVGQILMRNATVNVDTPAPADPFDAPAKTLGQLYLFDAQATAFQRVKVRGQVVHAETRRVFLMDGGMGIQVQLDKAAKVHAGDIIEAVGYPEISGPSPLLRQAIVRKVGAATLPAATLLTKNDLTRAGLDLTRVKVEGKLLGWHKESGVLVLEMQSGSHLYFARVASNLSNDYLPRPGSQLALTGVYVGGADPRAEGAAESFHLLLNSPFDITVLSQPPWWTLQRLLVIVGVLIIVLMFALLWITQLRRLVEQRTNQLQRETHERERVERQHALEAERSRIARDLHDDLGSSLTEISVLANTGQRPQNGEGNFLSLFGAIADKSRNLISALDVIVWAVDPAENSLQSLADYLSGYADEYCSHAHLNCRFKVPVSFPSVALDGRVRHELFMAVKETLNNIVRHAEATDVEFQMAVSDRMLHIVIADNGRGFEPGTGRAGHGLENLSGRLKKLAGSCAVESSPSGGTTVKFRLPLPAPAGTPTEPARN